MTKECKVCKKEYYVKPCDYSRRVSCSIACKKTTITGENNPFRKVSYKYKGENSSRWKEKVKKLCEICDTIFLVKPSHENTRRFCSYLCKGKWITKNKSGVNNHNYGKDYFGDKNPNWKGGCKRSELSKLRNKKVYIEWKIKVLERDEKTCVKCEYKHKEKGDIHADHILSFKYFPELRYELSNGRTLCRECHQRTDNYGGRVNTFAA